MPTEKAKNFESKKATVPQESRCIVAFTAGINISGAEVFIVAPTLDDLENAWNSVQRFNTKFDRNAVQHICIFSSDRVSHQ